MQSSLLSTIQPTLIFTFRVLCGFLILDDFLMSTSVVFTQPGWKWKNRETKESWDVKFLISAFMTCSSEPEERPWRHSHWPLSTWPQSFLSAAVYTEYVTLFTAHMPFRCHSQWALRETGKRSTWVCMCKWVWILVAAKRTGLEQGYAKAKWGISPRWYLHTTSHTVPARWGDTVIGWLLAPQVRKLQSGEPAQIPE